MKTIFTLLSLLLITSIAFSQRKAWSLIDANDGLISNNVQSIYAENDSTVWVGTDQGLCLYNGSQVSFKFIGGLSSTAQNIRKLAYGQNKLWILTDYGISAYSNGSFTNYDTTNGLLTNHINDFCIDSQDNIWIGTNNEVSKFDGSNFTHYQSESAKIIGVDSNDNVFGIDPFFILPTVSTISVFDGSSWNPIPADTSLPFSRINRLFQSEDGRLIAQTQASMYFEFNYPFNPVRHPIKFSDSLVNYHFSALEVYQNKTWVGVNIPISSLFYTEDSLLKDYNTNIREINTIEFFNDNLYVGTKNGLAYADKDARPLELNNQFDLNDIAVNINVKRGIFQSSVGNIGFELPKGSGNDAIYSSEFITVAKKGSWFHNPDPFGNHGGAGPISSNLLGYEWAYIVKVSQAEINNHKSSYNNVGYQMPDGIANWPANGDSTLGMTPDLAPYYDANNNGCYDPKSGDYPIIKGEEALYWIKHSDDPNLKLEYHYMLYAYQSASDQDINQAVYLDFRVVNRETVRLDSVKTGYYVDWDLGNPTDDYIGCDSLNNTFYVYNGDSNDDTFNGKPGYGHNSPFVGAKFLSDSMTNFIYYNIGGGQNGDPSISYHWLLYMTSRWQNGRFVTYGGNGLNSSGTTNHPTPYMLTGNPYTQSGWTEANPGGGQAASAPGDRRGLASIPFYSLNPGESKTISVALGYGRKDSVQTHLENFPEMTRVLNNAKTVWDTINTPTSSYSTNFNCTVVGLTEQQAKESNQLTVYPNPSRGIITVESGEKLEELQLVNYGGQVIRSDKTNNFNTSMDLRNLPQGMYILRIKAKDQEWTHRKLVLSK